MENHLLHFQVILTTLDEKMCKEVKFLLFLLYLKAGSDFRIRQPWKLPALIHLLENKSTYLKLRLFKIELPFLDQSSANNRLLWYLESFLHLTIIKKVGTVPRDNLGGMMVVNTRMELCGAFINRCLSHNSTSWCCTFNVLFSSQDECYLCELYCERSSKRREESEVRSI